MAVILSLKIIKKLARREPNLYKSKHKKSPSRIFKKSRRGLSGHRYYFNFNRLDNLSKFKRRPVSLSLYRRECCRGSHGSTNSNITDPHP